MQLNVKCTHYRGSYSHVSHLTMFCKLNGWHVTIRGRLKIINGARAAWRECHDDDVIKWKHFPRYWPLARGIHRSPMVSPHKGLAQRPATRSFGVSFDLHLNKSLSKELRRRWFETPPHSSWRHCNYGSPSQLKVEPKVCGIDPCSVSLCANGGPGHKGGSGTPFWHIEVKIKWSPFCRRHFQIHFSVQNYCILLIPVRRRAYLNELISRFCLWLNGIKACQAVLHRNTGIRNPVSLRNQNVLVRLFYTYIYISINITVVSWGSLWQEPPTLPSALVVQVKMLMLTIRPEYRISSEKSNWQITHKFCNISKSWWRHQIKTFSELLDLCEGNPPVTGGFPSPRPVTRSFDVFFDLRLNKRLSEPSRRRWFEETSRSLWRQCNVPSKMPHAAPNHFYVQFLRDLPCQDWRFI